MSPDGNAPMSESWTKLQSQADADRLLDVFGGFHDACLKEAHVATGHYVAENLAMGFGETTVRLLIQRQFEAPSAIEMLFEGVVRFNLVAARKGYVCIISSATLLVGEGGCHWADRGGWTPGSPDAGEVTWVEARSALWRHASGWMGPQLRYGPGGT